MLSICYHVGRLKVTITIHESGEVTVTLEPH